MRHIFVILSFVAAALGGGCGNLTTVGNPQGLPTEVTFTSDIESETEGVGALTVASGDSCRGVSSACASPSAYSIAFTRFGVFHCGDSLPCPGDRGEEVPSALVEDLQVVREGALNHFIYVGDDVSGDPETFGEVGSFETDPIEQAGWIGGMQILLDFVMLQFPEGLLNLGVGGSSPEYVLLFLNQDGFDNSGDYPEVFSPLAEKGIQFGDLAFYLSGEWYFFDTALGNFVTARPAAPLGQEINLDAGDGGASVYNASLGDPPFEILQEYLDISQTLTMTVPWAAELNLYWDDTSGNQEIDLEEMATLEVGKPQITTSITLYLVTL